MSKTAIITGITGQDGSHLADFLLEKGYRVVGITRRVSSEPPSRMRKHLWDKVIQFSGDLLDSFSLERAIKEYEADEFYNLAAQSHVGISWEQPELTLKINTLGTLACLKAIHIIKPDTKFYQASTSEMFGNINNSAQNEKSPFYPRSPYALSKLTSHWLTVNYRESYNMFAVSGILFNHEGPRRGKNFVTRKISNYVANYKLGRVREPLQLGNLDARRDWGYAPDYVRAMWLMLQQEEAEDFVIGTGENHSVREFVEEAFKLIGVSLNWRGKGVDEGGLRSDTGEVVVKVTPKLFRPVDVHNLKADPRKAKEKLGWEPTVSFKELVKLMVAADLKSLSRDSNP